MLVSVERHVFFLSLSFSANQGFYVSVNVAAVSHPHPIAVSRSFEVILFLFVSIVVQVFERCVFSVEPHVFSEFEFYGFNKLGFSCANLVCEYLSTVV